MGHPHPDLRSMLFADGTNILCRLAETKGLKIDAYKPPFEALAIAREVIDYVLRRQRDSGRMWMARRYWFGSYSGDEAYGTSLAEELRRLQFEPVLVKLRDKKEKGVDIAVACTMLVNAFQGNYSVGVLVAGDEDYLRLVDEVKRIGPNVWGFAFKAGLSPKLKLAVDHFDDLDVGFDHTQAINPLLEKLRAKT